MDAPDEQHCPQSLPIKELKRYLGSVTEIRHVTSHMITLDKVNYYLQFSKARQINLSSDLNISNINQGVGPKSFDYLLIRLFATKNH